MSHWILRHNWCTGKAIVLCFLLRLYILVCIEKDTFYLICYAWILRAFDNIKRNSKAGIDQSTVEDYTNPQNIFFQMQNTLVDIFWKLPDWHPAGQDQALQALQAHKAVTAVRHGGQVVGDREVLRA